jgi:hypothetical protein
MPLPLFVPPCRHAWIANPWALAEETCVYCGAPKPETAVELVPPPIERRREPAFPPELVPAPRRVDWRARHREIRRRT